MLPRSLEGTKKSRFLGALELLFGSHNHRSCLGLFIQDLYSMTSIRSESSKRDARTNWFFFLKLSFCCVFMLQGYPVIFTPNQHKRNDGLAQKYASIFLLFNGKNKLKLTVPWNQRNT